MEKSLDLNNFDNSESPGKDFNKYVNGTWLKENKIPEKYSKWGTFEILHEENLDRLNKIIKKNYWTDKPIANLGLRAYVQNNKENSSFYHNHKTPGSISGIFYLDPPQEGGEISFLINPDQDIPHLKEIIFKPKKNKLYLFPYWMYHKPLPQKDEDYRICFNWVHGSPTRPIHKFTKSQW